MTIAACYVTSEAVILGADSTATTTHGSTARHYDFAQKLFQIGDQDGSLGFVCWGLTGFKVSSFRTLLAQLSDDLIHHPPPNVADVITRWRNTFWMNYLTQYATERGRCATLASQSVRTDAENKELATLQRILSGGHCIGGHVQAERKPVAFAFEYNLLSTTEPSIYEISSGTARWWGCPNLVNRMLYGIDSAITHEILASGNWNASPNDLGNIINKYALRIPCELPVREAIDWIYSSIFVTIKAMKFSCLPPVCGGPIEIAVITSDRKFRWVCHKSMRDAISLPIIASELI